MDSRCFSACSHAFRIRVYDKTADGNKGSDNKVVLETINDGMDNDARRLSNVKLVGTP